MSLIFETKVSCFIYVLNVGDAHKWFKAGNKLTLFHLKKGRFEMLTYKKEFGAFFYHEELKIQIYIYLPLR